MADVQMLHQLCNLVEALPDTQHCFFNNLIRMKSNMLVLPSVIFDHVSTFA